MRAYNVGTGVETTVLDLARALQGAAGSNVPVQHAPARLGEQQRSSVNIDKAARELKRLAPAIVRAIDRHARRGGECYLPWYWRPILAVVRSTPERVFQRLRFLSGR